ncbi:MAG: hypothetical protein IPN49_16665 [Saprospiraceae bacterium]|nr:hypothetical protein [Saprospiraceae bacterium]
MEKRLGLIGNKPGCRCNFERYQYAGNGWTGTLSILNKRDLLLKSVMISAYGDISQVSENAMNLGAFDFITKPIDRQDLSITIEKQSRRFSRQDQVLK